MTQKLEVFQSMWAMEQRRPDGFNWPLEQRIEMIAEAGYTGVAIDFAWNDLADARACLPLLQRYDLACALVAFPKTAEDLQGLVDLSADFDTRYIAINARYFPWTAKEAVPRVRQWLEMGEKVGLPVYLETHRLTLTNDIVFTLDLMDLIPELEMVADLSHYLVAREFPQPIDELSSQLIDRILRRSATFQGRIGSREQIQVPLGFDQHAYWEGLFADWWRQGFKYWRQRNDADAVLNFSCELGPPPYAITGQDGYELSDRCQEGLEIKRRVEKTWEELEEEETKRG